MTMTFHSNDESKYTRCCIPVRLVKEQFPLPLSLIGCVGEAVEAGEKYAYVSFGALHSVLVKYENLEIYPIPFQFQEIPGDFDPDVGSVLSMYDHWTTSHCYGFAMKIPIQEAINDMFRTPQLFNDNQINEILDIAKKRIIHLRGLSG